MYGFVDDLWEKAKAAGSTPPCGRSTLAGLRGLAAHLRDTAGDVLDKRGC